MATVRMRFKQPFYKDTMLALEQLVCHGTTTINGSFNGKIIPKQYSQCILDVGTKFSSKYLRQDLKDFGGR